MGIKDFFTKQFIDVIEWTESEEGVLAMRYLMQDMEIQNGAKLTVRESQIALFVNEGKIADSFGPGLHTLNTNTLPILTNLQNWDKAFASPFKSDLYFFSTRQQIDQKWGTPTPVTVRDKEFGGIRIRMFGNYSYHISDVKMFHQKISGTRQEYTTTEIDGQLRGIILTAMSAAIGSSEIPFIDLAANQQKFSDALSPIIGKALEPYGLQLDSFLIQNVSLPEELQKVFDERTSMNIVGDMGRYAQFQAAKSIPIAAANEGGVAGAGVGLGAGVAMGQAMAQAFSNTTQNVQAGAAKTDPVQTLDTLKQLLNKGLISQQEYDTKKLEILGRM